MDLVDELNLLHLSGKIDLIFVERPELQPAKIKTDAVIYLLDASVTLATSKLAGLDLTQ